MLQAFGEQPERRHHGPPAKSRFLKIGDVYHVAIETTVKAGPYAGIKLTVLGPAHDCPANAKNWSLSKTGTLPSRSLLKVA